MALSPLKPATDRAAQIAPVIPPSKTYTLDFDTGNVGELIDGKEAVRQFIRKAIATARFRFLIYNNAYGCELDDLIGQDVPTALLEAEIPRVISEALIYDERIRDVNNFAVERTGDALYVSFDVLTTEGIIREEVTI